MSTEEAHAREDTKPTGSAYGSQNNKENENDYTRANQGGQAEEDELDVLRAHRLAELKAKMDQKKKDRQVGYGSYMEVSEEDFLKEVTTAPTVICHFYHREFAKCAVMDKHLEILAKQYPQIKFIKLNAEKAPFIVARLQVKTLPTVIRFRDGIADNKERLIGFEGLGGVEDFPTKNVSKAFITTRKTSLIYM
jgi:thiol-disulfide isomerase/thioredoxin